MRVIVSSGLYTELIITRYFEVYSTIIYFVRITLLFVVVSHAREVGVEASSLPLGGGLLRPSSS